MTGKFFMNWRMPLFIDESIYSITGKHSKRLHNPKPLW